MCLECGCGENTAFVCPECGGRVILIDEETKCLSCGAAPPLEAVSAGHEGIHDHPHRVDHENLTTIRPRPKARSCCVS